MRKPDSIELNQVWHLSDQLGSGGFANVYLARNSGGETAVVKLVRKETGAQRELLFVDLEGIPNVVPVLDSGELDDYFAIVMPRAEKSLRDYLAEKGGQLSLDLAISILVDVAETLVGAEDRVVHRDIKPENVLLLDDRWHLADFGIARYAEATTAPDTLKYAKTPAYAAPEQWREERATSTADVYALGVVAYELLTGQQPFQGPDYRRQHLEESPERLTGFPERVRSLVSECLYKSPQARPRPQNLLERLKRSLTPASPGAELLQQANLLAVDRQAEEARQQSIAQSEAERRLELIDAAHESLENILALLDQQITVNASEVLTSSGSDLRSWSLNDATLRVNRSSSEASESDSNMPFKVIVHTAISLTVPADRSGYTGRSHSLWYCDAQKPDVFRWYETAFMQISRRPDRSVAPFYMSPGARDVVLALSSAMHTYQVAWPFVPIDQGDEELFIERWILRFAEAAQGQLRYPSSMPELDPGGSWRRGN